MANEAVFTIGMLLKVSDEATDDLRKFAQKTKQEFKSLTDSIKNFSETLIKAGAISTAFGVATLAAALQPIKAYGDMEEAITRAKLAFMKEGGIDPFFGAVEKTIISLGNLMPGTNADFAEQTEILGKYGLSAKLIADQVETGTGKITGGALRATANLVLVEKMSNSAAAALIGGAGNALGLVGSEFLLFADQASKASSIGLEIGNLGAEVEKFASTAQSMGMKGAPAIKQLFPLLAFLARKGQQGADVGTSLKSSFAKLSEVSEKIKKGDIAKTLKESGIKLEFFKDGKPPDLNQFVEQLSQLRKISSIEKRSSIIKDLFQEENLNLINAIVNGGVEGIRAIEAEMESKVSLDKKADELLKLQINKWNALTGSIGNFLAMIGGTVSDGIKPMIDSANQLAGVLAGWVEKHPILTKYLFGTTIAAGALATVVGVGLMGAGGIGLLISKIPAAIETLSNLGMGFRAVRNWAQLARFGIGRFATALTTLSFAQIATGMKTLALGILGVAKATILAAWATIKWAAAFAISPLGLILEGLALLAGLGVLIWRNWSNPAGLFKGILADLKGMGKAISGFFGFGSDAAGKEMEKSMQGVKDFIPQSPAKKGPFRDFSQEKFGQALLPKLHGGGAAQVPAPVSRIAGGTSPISISMPVSITIQGGTGKDAENIAKQLEPHVIRIMEKVQAAQTRREYR